MKDAPLIHPQLSNEEQAKVDEIFAGVEEHLGFVPDGLKLYSVSPPLLEAFLGALGYFLSHPSLGQELLAMIRFIASSEHQCQFCIGLNEKVLMNLGVDIDAARAAVQNPDKAPLEQKEIALLKQVLKVLHEPDSQTQTDIEYLVSLGFTQREIFEAEALGTNNRSFTTMLKAFHVHQQGAFA